MVIVKFIYFLTEVQSFVLKNRRTFFNWRCVYFVRPLEYLIKKLPVPTKRATVSLIKVKSDTSF